MESRRWMWKCCFHCPYNLALFELDILLFFHLKMLEFPKTSHLCLHGLHYCSHQTLNVRDLFSPLQVYFSDLNLTAILNMLKATFQAPFSNFLNERDPGTWIPLGFLYCVTYQSPIENDFPSDLRLLKAA